MQPNDPETNQPNERGDQQLLLSRQELFDLVWASPRQTLAARYPSISAAVVTRTCEEANIPLPGRGYWAKVAEGQSVRRPPMPVRWPGQDDLVVLGRRTDRYGVSDRRSDVEIAASDPPNPPVFDDDIDQLVDAAVAQLRPVKVCLLYTSPSPRDGLLSRMPSSA